MVILLDVEVHLVEEFARAIPCMLLEIRMQFFHEDGRITLASVVRPLRDREGQSGALRETPVPFESLGGAVLVDLLDRRFPAGSR
jgi:hypothetical protein